MQASAKISFLSGREWKSIVKYFNLDIIITTGNPNPSEAASSGGKKYDVYAHFSKGGEAKATMQFPFDKRTLTKRLADVKRGLYSTQANSRVSLSEKEQRIQEFGRELFNALFCGRIHTLYEAVKRGLNREDEERLRIRLRIHSPELAVLPWELMYDPYAHSYLCQNLS